MLNGLNAQCNYSEDSMFQLLLEYFYLSNCPGITDEDADRLDSILQLAENDELFNALISKLDILMSEGVGRSNEVSLNEVENQKARLREYLEVMSPKCELDKLAYH